MSDESVMKQLENFAPAIGDVVRNDTPQKALKLSQLIRIGCKATTQLRCKDYISANGRSACVWGAVAIALGGGRELAAKLHWEDFYKEARRAFFAAHNYTPLSANDRYGWTREQIADWLESQGY